MTDFLHIATDTLRVAISPYGASLARVWLKGHPTSLILGLPTPEDYAGAPHSIGVIVGPLAGRTSNARVTLNGQTYQMEPNAPPDCLHSGAEGLQHRRWEVESHTDNALTLRCDLPDGACGLPGNRIVRALYAVTDTDLSLTIEAESDADTVFNAANHAYWTLDGSGDLTAHRLEVASSRMIETSLALIPTGQLTDLTGSPHDFRSPKCPVAGPPLDGTFALDETTPALRLTSERSPVTLEVATNQPGVVLYAGSGLHEREMGPDLPPMAPFSALAIEAQGWPDAPNQPHFPTALLQAGQKLAQSVIFGLALA